MKSHAITINTSSGLALSARWETPDNPSIATALFAHCFTCGKDVLAASRISRRLVELGYAVLRFDFTGLGMSEGDFAETNFSSNISDLIDVVAWMKQTHEAPAIVIGHSLGGTAILAAAEHLVDARAFVTIGSPSDPRHIFNLIGESSMQEIEHAGDAMVSLAGRHFHIKKQFVEDAREQHVLKQVRQLNRPLMIMHSPQDETVPIEHATSIFHAAAHPKSFVSLGNADHLLSDKIDAIFIAEMIFAWSSRQLNN